MRYHVRPGRTARKARQLRALQRQESTVKNQKAERRALLVQKLLSEGAGPKLAESIVSRVLGESA